MSIYSLYFSPTGGVKKAADILMENISVDVQIDLSNRDVDYKAYHFNKEDVCFISIPSYGGRVPAIVLERLKQMKANGALAIVVVVFGNRAYDDTLLEIKNEMSACGFTVGAAIAAVSEHSIMHTFASGRPDANDEEDLRGYSAKIRELIAHRENAKEFTVPGNHPYKEFGGVPIKPKANKACTECGLCAEKCPVGAIPAGAPSSLNEDKCISCMRCVAICPQQSRQVNKGLLFVATQSLKKVCSSRKENELHM